LEHVVVIQGKGRRFIADGPHGLTKEMLDLELTLTAFSCPVQQCGSIQVNDLTKPNNFTSLQSFVPHRKQASNETTKR
jgi:hypothetical protein